MAARGMRRPSTAQANIEFTLALCRVALAARDVARYASSLIECEPLSGFSIRIRKSPGHGGEDRGFLGSIWGEPAMTREGHRNNQIVIPDLSSTLFCVTFFPHPDGNLPLEMWAASVSPRWPFALVGDFSR
jgi:hypothetical protein